MYETLILDLEEIYANFAEICFMSYGTNGRENINICFSNLQKGLLKIKRKEQRKIAIKYCYKSVSICKNIKQFKI